MAGSERVPALVVRRRRWVFAAWTLAAVVLLPATRSLDGRLQAAARADDSESARVDRELVERFASPFAHYAVLVVGGVPAPSGAEGRAALRTLVDGLTRSRGTTRVLSYLSTPDTLFLGDSATFLLVGLDDRAGASDALLPPLRHVTGAAERALRTRYPGATLEWTGDVALNADLRGASAADAQSAERRVLPLSLGLLAVAFGALAAATLPIGAGGLAIVLSLGAVSMLAARWPLSVLVQNVVTMLGLGLGIDYSLLIVGRFRQARASGACVEEAASEAARAAGHTIALSGAAVGIGFAALLAVPLSELRSIAVGGLIVVAVSVLVATTLLPAVLAALGAHIEWGRVRRQRADGGAGWRRWASWVSAHPRLTLVVAAAPVVALSLQARRLVTEMPRGDWLPPAMESARALRRLQAMHRGGVVQTIRIVIELPDGGTALTPAGWSAIRALGDRLAADPRVARVRALPTLMPGSRPSLMLFAMLPDDVRRTLLSADQRLALVELLPHDDVDTRSLAALVGELRAANPGTLTGLPGARVRVGGLPAFNVDYESAVRARTPAVIALVVGGTLVALAVGFRSVLVPIKAVALNLLSVAAAFGAVVLVFQDGIGVRLLGLTAPIDGTFPAVPLLVFCIVFGLSMDYEVFLVARMAEARRHHSDDEALVEAMARTGGVVTSAAAIMIVVFGAFALGDFLLMKILGFALAVAVLLDATLVRIAIGPSLLVLAGRWNWWPGEARSRRSTGLHRPPRLGESARAHEIRQLPARRDRQLPEDVGEVGADRAR